MSGRLSPKEAAQHLIGCVSESRPELITAAFFHDCPIDTRLVWDGQRWDFGGFKFLHAKARLGVGAALAVPAYADCGSSNPHQ